MEPTNPNPEPPAGAPAPPAGSGDVTALQAQLEALQKQINEHKEGRAGAQRLAAQRETELKTLQVQLADVNQLMQSLQKDLESKADVEAGTKAQLEQLQAQVAQAQRKATVLELAGKSQPSLVPLLAEGLLNVTGETPEEIAASIGTVAARLSDFTKSTDAGQQEPGTPPPPPDSNRPPVPTATDKQARIKQLAEEKWNIAKDPTAPGWRQRLAALDKEIVEAEAGA